MLSEYREKLLREFAVHVGAPDLDMNLLDEALTHPSYVNEHQDLGVKHYERLEFLGDSYLKNVSAEYLFDKYPDYKEGQLTRLLTFMVSDFFLAYLADEINLPKYIRVGQSEVQSDGVHKESIKACAFEAFLAAVAKSGRVDLVKKNLCILFDSNGEYILNSINSYNSKAMLQEYTQSKDNRLPEYKVISQIGKPHNLTFEVAVYYNGEEIGRGTANSKKEAEKMAARDALKKLKGETE